MLGEAFKRCRITRKFESENLPLTGFIKTRWALMREIVTRATRDRRFREPWLKSHSIYKRNSEDYNYLKQDVGLIMKRIITINYVIFFSVMLYIVFNNV